MFDKMKVSTMKVWWNSGSTTVMVGMTEYRVLECLSKNKNIEQNFLK